MSTAQELAASSARLLTLPQIYWHVKRVIDDSSTTHSDLTKVILTDTAMTARVLRLVNSAFWGYRGRIESVSRAVALLGMLHVHDLVLASSIAATFRGIHSSAMNVTQFWQGSVYRASSAGSMARMAGLADAQRPFVEGLLSDIGHMILYQTVPKLALQARERAAADADRLPEIERELIGCDYAEVGSALVSLWGLPECFRVAIGSQDRPETAGDHALEAALLHIAGRLAEHDLAGRGPLENVVMSPSALSCVNLTFAQLSTVLEETRENLAALGSLLRDN